MTAAMSGDSGLRQALARVVGGERLDRAEAREALGEVLRGEASPVQIAAFLAALRVRGETIDEIAGMVEAMRAAAVPVRPARENLVDLCGTGGDGSHTINISTAASIVVAACGVPVAKHGNRSASSQCGSADVLEELGVPVELEPDRSAASIDELGFAFLFARTHHPAMRHVAPVRQELGVRTVFNLLGPLSSPAAVKRQLIGVFDDAFRPVMARVCQELGSEHVWVVHSVDEQGRGLDELSLAGPTRVTSLRGGEIEEFEVDPGAAGLERASLDDLRGGDAAHNAERLRQILGGETGPQTDAVLLNAAAALVVADAVSDLATGVQRAREALTSGAASKLLGELTRWK